MLNTNHAPLRRDLREAFDKAVQALPRRFNSIILRQSKVTEYTVSLELAFHNLDFEQVDDAKEVLDYFRFEAGAS